MRENVPLTRISYWQVFRLVFVLFSFYLLFDALYRWSGFRFYASFSEFLPNVGLVSILWSFIASLVALLMWLSIRAITLFYLQGNWSKVHRLLLFLYFLLAFGATIYFIKRLVWFYSPIPSHVKLVLYMGGFLAAILFTVAMERIKRKNKINVIQFIFTFVFFVTTIWIGSRMLSSDKQTSLPWMVLLLVSIVPASLCINWLLRNKFDLIQDRITIWVWIFGLFIISSVPMVGYQTTWKQTGKTVPHEHSLSSESDITRPNIILVTFDSLTTKDMSLYGYHRPTTPFIREWAQKASLFTGLKGASNYTASAFPSILTGKRVWTHRVFQPHGYKADKIRTENLMNLLKQSGYYNMAYIAILPIKLMGYGEFFDIIAPHNAFIKDLNFIEHIDLILYRFFSDKLSHYNWIIKKDFVFGKFLVFINEDLSIGKKVIYRYDLEKVFNTFIRDLDNNPPKPYFTHLHILHPHAPFIIPVERFKGMFGPVSDSDNPFQNRDRYDELIRYCDVQFKDFISKLAKRNRLENTVIVLSSDHGYKFKENRAGVDLRGYHLDEELTSIPLIIYNYEVEEGQIIDDIVGQIDIPATILDLANIPVPPWMEGRSLVPLMQGKKLEARPVFSMNFERNKSMDLITKGVIAVWEGNYKLIYYLEDEKSLLFNLKDDPDELKDLFDKETEIGQRLLKLILDNQRKVNERFSRGKR